MFESNQDFEFDGAMFNDPFDLDANKPTEIIPKPAQVSKLLDITPSKSFRSPTKKVILRKFPGPAGVLPERKDLKSTKDVCNAQKDTSSIDMDIICSQTTANTFESNVWQRMKRDFDPYLLEKYNIKWIKSKAQSSKLINQKAPFLAAIIQSIEVLKVKTAVAKIIVKDPIDLIHGLLVHDLYEEYLQDLVVGSVIILKQFGVLTTDELNHYINICANNLVAIYSSSGGTVKVTSVQNVTGGDILNNINETKSRHKAMALQHKLNPVINFQSANLGLQNNTYRLSTSNVGLIGHDVNKATVKVKYDGDLPSFSSSKVSNSVESKVQENKSKFNFKALKGSVSKEQGVSVTINSHQSQVNNPVEKISIIESVFEGVDTDLLFGDF